MMHKKGRCPECSEPVKIHFVSGSEDSLASYKAVQHQRQINEAKPEVRWIPYEGSGQPPRAFHAAVPEGSSGGGIM